MESANLVSTELDQQVLKSPITNDHVCALFRFRDLVVPAKYLLVKRNDGNEKIRLVILNHSFEYALKLVTLEAPAGM